MSRCIDADLVKPAMENSDDSLLNQPMTIRHVESLLSDLPTVQAVSLDRIKEARDELNKLLIERINIYDEGRKVGSFDCVHFDEVIEIIDKLIAE